MMPKRNPSFIERLAETLHLIPNLHGADRDKLPPIMEPGKLTDYPPPKRWDDWVSMHATSGQRRETKNNMIVPTTCLSWLPAAFGRNTDIVSARLRRSESPGISGWMNFRVVSPEMLKWRQNGAADD